MLEKYDDIHVVWPVHLNPLVRRSVVRVLGGLPHPLQDRIRLVEPLEYAQMLWVMRHAWLALTDSGGIQEEAASLHLPVLVARETTERPELIEAGGGALVGTDPSTILAWVDALHGTDEIHASMRGIVNPYGDGKAASSIARILARDLCAQSSALPTLAA
jgi:UDP-N-acetylglucosamine 2-epimerase